MAGLHPPVNDKDHIKGPAGASIVLTEYGDYQCPHCGAAHPVVKALLKAYSKELRFAFRHFPLSQIHEYAEAAAIAAEAAGRQNKFWEMHDMIFEHQQLLSPKSLTDFASRLGLDLKKFKTDIEENSLADKVAAHFESGVRSGVNGTPSFFINERKYDGSYDFESLAGAITLHIQTKTK